MNFSTPILSEFVRSYNVIRNKSTFPFSKNFNKYGILILLGGGLVMYNKLIVAKTESWDTFENVCIKNNLVQYIKLPPRSEIQLFERLSSKVYLDESKLKEYNLENPSQKINSSRFYLPPINLSDIRYFVDSYNQTEGLELEDKIQVISPASIPNVAVWLAFLGVTIFFLRSNQFKNPSSNIFTDAFKTKFRKVDATKVNISFKDIAGCAEVKTEIIEFVNFLKNPDQCMKLGGKTPRGVLLKGPPGTGKTLIAKATAGEAQVPFLSVSGSEFNGIFYGLGVKRVKNLFETARSYAPCILFIDEIDALGKKRMDSDDRVQREVTFTLNQLLTEMDGMEKNSNIIVMAATNRPEVLDFALLRPGRFDRQVYVPLPDIKDRSEIFMIYLKKLKLASDSQDAMTKLSRYLAARSSMMSGAEIANVCNEAALIAARHKSPSIGYSHFDAALERVQVGLERAGSSIMCDEEKRVVAHHEGGHAVVGWFLEHADPLLKVSIIPRAQALGYALFLPRDSYLMIKQEFLDKIAMALGGRVAEEIFFGVISSGAKDDLLKVTEMAYLQVAKLGFSNKVGHLSYPMPYQAVEMMSLKPYSEMTMSIMDQEVRQIIAEQYERVRQLLQSKKEYISKLAEILLEKETLTKDDLIKILGPRPFKEMSTYAEFLDDADHYRNSEKKVE